jgi:SAM-dependent methyltransferase
MAFGEEELRRAESGCALDLGCGAGRNAVPLARLDWSVVGTDLSWPMLVAAAARTREDRLNNHLHLILAPMDRIPARDGSFDLAVAHGIWNLARSNVGALSAGRVSIEDWHRLLNGRIFFWVDEKRLNDLRNARAYRNQRQTVLFADTQRLAER